MDTTPNSTIGLDEPPGGPGSPSGGYAHPVPPGTGYLHPDSPAGGCARVPAQAPPPTPPALTEPKGCLYALSQPPLMLFLAVIAILLAVTGAHDLLML